MDQGTGLILGQAVSFPGVTENFSVWRDYPLVVTSQLNGEVLKHVKLERDQWENGWKRKGRGWGGVMRMNMGRRRRSLPGRWVLLHNREGVSWEVSWHCSGHAVRTWQHPDPTPSCLYDRCLLGHASNTPATSLHWHSTFAQLHLSILPN